MIRKITFDKKIFSFEFVDANNEYHYVYFNNDNISEMKSKIKEYKKNGTLTFTKIEGTAAISQNFKPKYIRVSRMLEMYIQEEKEEIENASKDIPT